MKQSILELRDVCISIAGKVLCSNLSASLDSNQSWALLGRNGAGKTTLLQGIIGLRPIQAGDILIEGQSLREIRRRDLAARVGMLFQDGIATLPATVMETVLLGRHPHLQSLLIDQPEDIALAKRALEDLELTPLADREIGTLSGGERQRLALAMVITQAPTLYLLDEPNNHLDLGFQVKLLSLLQQTASRQQACLLMATHDINLAARFCDHVILMLNDGACLSGSKEQILTEANLSQAYSCSIRSIKEDGMTLFYPA
jgi:iron complex transport system ATP-binding protein